LSIDHKPELEIERNRITQAGGFIYGGRVNGSLNLARAIGLFSCICIDSSFIEHYNVMLLTL
jgi:serine/threonine protein phosphatase PrpC